MPEDAMRRAKELAQQCDLFLAIGSSLVVWPAAGFPLMAKSAGARLVIINNEPTNRMTSPTWSFDMTSGKRWGRL